MSVDLIVGIRLVLILFLLKITPLLVSASSEAILSGQSYGAGELRGQGQSAGFTRWPACHRSPPKAL